MLVMIGRNWMRITDTQGNRRLDDPADHIRAEIAAALKQSNRCHSSPRPRFLDGRDLTLYWKTFANLRSKMG